MLSSLRLSLLSSQAAPKLWTFDMKEVGFWEPNKGGGGNLPKVTAYMPPSCDYDKLPVDLTDKLRWERMSR